MVFSPSGGPPLPTPGSRASLMAWAKPAVQAVVVNAGGGSDGCQYAALAIQLYTTPLITMKPHTTTIKQIVSFNLSTFMAKCFSR